MTMNYSNLVVWLVLSAFFISFSAGPTLAQISKNDQQSIDSDIGENYIIGAGDVLDCHITCKESDITIDYVLTVSPGGAIFIPGMDKAYVAGLTINQVKNQIQGKVINVLKEDVDVYVILRNISRPNDISFASARPYVYVYGEVKSAGRIPFMPESKLSDYVNFSGGATEKASLSDVSISRHVDGKKVTIKVNLSEVYSKGDAAEDILIYPGDVINVPRNFYYMSDFASVMGVVLTIVTAYGVIRK